MNSPPFPIKRLIMRVCRERLRPNQPLEMISSQDSVLCHHSHLLTTTSTYSLPSGFPPFSKFRNYFLPMGPSRSLMDLKLPGTYSPQSGNLGSTIVTYPPPSHHPVLRAHCPLCPLTFLSALTPNPFPVPFLPLIPQINESSFGVQFPRSPPSPPQTGSSRSTKSKLMLSSLCSLYALTSRVSQSPITDPSQARHWVDRLV